jgi:hypothetical protein
MAIKKYKPTTPGRRGMTVTDYSVLSKVEPERSLLEPMKKSAGRNNTGRITVRHHGGGNRTKYRVIDFKRDKLDMPPSRRWNTIPTARRISRWCNTRTARSAISSRPRALRWATPL